MADLNPAILARLKELDEELRELADAALQLPQGTSEPAAVEALLAKVRDLVRRKARV